MRVTGWELEFTDQDCCAMHREAEEMLTLPEQKGGGELRRPLEN